MKPTLDERQNLWRYLYARTSLTEAQDWITLLEKSSERSGVTDALFTAAVVAYARPFRASEFPGKKRFKALDDAPPGTLANAHEQILLLRDKFMGHKDGNAPELHSFPPNMILFTRDQEGWNFSTLVFTRPKPEFRAQIQDLCKFFISKCALVVDTFSGKYAETLNALSIGTYRIRHEDDDRAWIESIDGWMNR